MPHPLSINATSAGSPSSRHFKSFLTFSGSTPAVQVMTSLPCWGTSSRSPTAVRRTQPPGRTGSSVSAEFEPGGRRGAATAANRKHLDR